MATDINISLDIKSVNGYSLTGTGNVEINTLETSDLVITDNVRTVKLGGNLSTDILDFTSNNGLSSLTIRGDRNVVISKNLGVNGALPSGFYGLNMLGDINTNGKLYVGSEIRMEQSGFSFMKSVGYKLTSAFNSGFEWGKNASTIHMTLSNTGQLNLSSLPIASVGLSAGDIWNNSGVINIV